MSTNSDKFRTDLKKLIQFGRRLQVAMVVECLGDEARAKLKKQQETRPDGALADLPVFKSEYQRWYSEALALVRQILPDRVSDFIRHYEKPKGRKEITYENYRIEDYLQGLRVRQGLTKETLVDKDAAVPHFEQQLAIVEAAEARFESSLFDIRHILQADLLDTELEAASHLRTNKFFRAAGALAGVVLERHLGQVCADHQLSISKKHPTIADFNEALKAANIIDVPQWRFVQHLSDLRNLCDHARANDPTAEQIDDLITGVTKVTKTVF